MGLARALARRSTCARASVGCVVVSSDNHRVLAIGYNGNARGFPNACDSTEPGNCGCIHAEDNCLIKLDYAPHTGRRMYITCSPCKTCAKRIVNAGIDEVIYDTEYRNTDGIFLLNAAGVLVGQLRTDV